MGNLPTLASPSGFKICGTENGLPILASPLSAEVRSRLTAEIEELEAAISSTCTRADIDRCRVMLAASLIVSRDDEATIAIEREAWAITLTDAEMNGPIPKWVLEKATKEFMAGNHGRFFPKVGEMIAVCKAIIARYRGAIVERRQVLCAPVAPADTAEANERRTAMLERLRAVSPLFAEPVKAPREIVPDDGWAERRAAVLAKVADMERRAR